MYEDQRTVIEAKARAKGIPVFDNIMETVNAVTAHSLFGSFITKGVRLDCFGRLFDEEDAGCKQCAVSGRCYGEVVKVLELPGKMLTDKRTRWTPESFNQTDPKTAAYICMALLLGGFHGTVEEIGDEVRRLSNTKLRATRTANWALKQLKSNSFEVYRDKELKFVIIDPDGNLLTQGAGERAETDPVPSNEGDGD